MDEYERNLRLHIIPVLGDFMLEEITPPMIQDLLNDFQRSGHKSATVVRIYIILSGIFKSAYMDYSIAQNPMDRVARPKKPKEEVKNDEALAYTADELRRILSLVDAHSPLKWKVFIHLVADTGIRRGEACGLMWRNVRFDDNSINICQSLNYTSKNGVYVSKTKNGKSRVVDISPKVAALLLELKNEQEYNGLFSEYVFTMDGDTSPMHPDSPSRYFLRFGKKYGIEDFHVHKLRHTQASLAIQFGADVASVSRRLGHSDISVTLRTYTHANEESIRAAGNVFRQGLFK